MCSEKLKRISIKQNEKAAHTFLISSLLFSYTKNKRNENYDLLVCKINEIVICFILTIIVETPY